MEAPMSGFGWIVSCASVWFKNQRACADRSDALTVFVSHTGGATFFLIRQFMKPFETQVWPFPFNENQHFLPAQRIPSPPEIMALKAKEEVKAAEAQARGGAGTLEHPKHSQQKKMFGYFPM